MSDRVETPDARREASGRTLYTVFAAGWAGYAVLHETLTYVDWFRLDYKMQLAQGLAVIALGLFVLGRPGSVWRLVLLCLSMIGMAAWDGPFWPNHVFHTLVVNLALLGVCLFRLARPVRGLSVQASIGETFAPIGRCCLIVLYAWVFVNKINRDYLDPEVSCGWVLYTEVVAFVRETFWISLPAGDWMRYPSLLGALAAEAAVPVLLIFRRTRVAGLALGLAFHFLLTLHPNMYIAGFTAMMYAHFILFLPEPSLVRLVTWWRRTWLGRRSGDGMGLRVPCIIAAGFAGYGILIAAIAVWRGALTADGVSQVFDRLSPYAVISLWLATVGVVFYVFARFVVFGRESVLPRQSFFMPRPAVLLMVPLAAFVNGLSPYVGLKTHNAYAMFSNLRTEGGVNNHLFLPTSLRVVDYQDDLVVVLESNHGRLPVNKPGERTTWFEFRRLIQSAGGNARITYRRGDEPPRTINRRDIDTDPALAPPPRFLRGTMYYKTVPIDGEPCGCRW